MYKLIPIVLFIFICNASISQPIILKQEKIARWKGGGGALYNVLSFNLETGSIKLDSIKLTYTQANIKNETNDLVLNYGEIRSIRRSNFLLLFPIKLIIKMNDGTYYYFSMFKRKRIIEVVRSHIEVYD